MALMMMVLLGLACLSGTFSTDAARVLPLPSQGSTKWHKPDFYHDKEGPRFTNETKDTPYEVRRYAESTWAGYKSEDSGFVVAEAKAYAQLTRYFKGANVKDAHLDLTTPVVTSFEPNADYSASNDHFGVYFYLPHEAPKPQVDGVFVKKLPGVTAYVRSFGGYASADDILSQAKALRGDLQEDKVDFIDAFFAFATYDSPARFYDRHNEVAFIEKRAAEAPGGHAHPHHPHYSPGAARAAREQSPALEQLLGRAYARLCAVLG